MSGHGLYYLLVNKGKKKGNLFHQTIYDPCEHGKMVIKIMIVNHIFVLFLVCISYLALCILNG